MGGNNGRPIISKQLDGYVFLGPTGAATFGPRFNLKYNGSLKAVACGQRSHDLSVRFHSLPALPHTRRHETGVAVRVSGSAVRLPGAPISKGFPLSF